MNTILVLSHNRQHFEFYCRDWLLDEHTKLLNTNDERHLYGLCPIAIVKLPEWYLNKSEAYMEYLKVIQKRMDKRSPLR